MPNINTTPMPTEPGANAVSELSDQLRADVRLLTTLLGQVLKEGGSSGLFDDVEALRQATIAAHRDSSPEAFARATEIAESFPVERADEVARAFTVYFHLVNLAEEFQRVRMLREGHPEVEGATDTIPKAMAQLREEIGEEAARRRLENLRFHPVFTAHPTEARRRAVSTSIRRIARLLEEQVVVGADQVAGRRVHRRLLEEIDTLWRTAPLRSTKPGPEDEVRSLMSIFDETLYTTLPRVYRYVDDALQPESAGRQEPLVRPFIRLGTWVGGDRDGNPFVTPSVTKQAAAIASDHVLRGLEHTATTIARGLTLDSDATPPSPALVTLWQNLAGADDEAAEAATISAPNEPHKQVMMLIARRISATRTRNADLAYGDPDDSSKTSRSSRSHFTPPGHFGRRSVPFRPCCGRSRPSASIWRSWRFASIPRCTPRHWRNAKRVTHARRRPRGSWRCSGPWPRSSVGTAGGLRAVTSSRSPSRPPTSLRCTSWRAIPALTSSST